MIRFVKVTGDKAIPLPDSKADQATHEIECTEEQYNKAVNSDYFVVENGEPRHPTAQEESDRAAAQAEAAEVSRITGLWQAYRNFQNEHLTDDLAAMYYMEKANSTKAQEVLDWKDALWTQYYQDKANGVDEPDFSSVAAMPHDYLSIRAEIEGV